MRILKLLLPYLALPSIIFCEKHICDGDVILVKSKASAIKWVQLMCSAKVEQANRIVNKGSLRSLGYDNFKGKLVKTESRSYYCEWAGEQRALDFITIRLDKPIIAGEQVSKTVTLINNPKADTELCEKESVILAREKAAEIERREQEIERQKQLKAEKEQFERELAAAKNELIPLIQYYNPQRGDNMLATEKYAAELAQYGYQKIRVEACVGPPRKPKNKAENQYWSYESRNYVTRNDLVLYWNGERQDNITDTTYASSDLKRYKYGKIRDQGMTLSSDDRGDTEVEGSIPLKLYYHGQRQDNISVATPEGEQSVKSAGYGFIKEQGYVWPPSFCK